MFNMYFHRSNEEIERLNKVIRPVLKKGFLGRYNHITFLAAKEDYQNEKTVGVAKGLSTLRTANIKLPTRGYASTVVITPEIVLGQLTDKQLEGVTNYYVSVQYPKDYFYVTMVENKVDAKVFLLGKKQDGVKASNKEK